LRTPDGAPGIKAEYFANPTLTGPPALARTDSKVDFDFISPTAPPVTRQPFSVRWTGVLIPPKTSEYRLGLAARDGVRLYLDDSLLIDDWGRHPARTVTAPVRLQAGRSYRITVEHFQFRDDSSVRLVWAHSDLLRPALEATRNADVVVAAVGISPQLEGEEMTDVSSPGFFGGDRVDLDLPKPQQEMLEAVAATGKPLIVVLLNGSALTAKETWTADVRNLLT